ncbi:MAG: pseudouridylate synthase [Dysgonamonadaceae bacterium]|jgi:3-hydroxymyristoyl/3-hydroxydecanoyl-(acyl carrier protein) dehydratase|nr:pseudouridylate synthase [Dysgonamonadaceae bacterium]
MEQINIQDLIPQKEPFIMVEKLLFCDLERTKTSLSITNDNIFVENDIFSQSGIIENVAQTCAARLGYLNRNQPVKIGMIGSINDFEFSGVLPEAGQEIITEISVEAEVGQVILLNASVLCNENMIATGKMKVVLTDKEI